MPSSIEVLDNKVNFLIYMTQEIHNRMNLSLDFDTFVINNDLTSTQVVLVIKSLTILNYRRLGTLDEHLDEFKNDFRFSTILNNNMPTFNEFREFLKSIDVYVNEEILLKSLEKQKIGENICKFLLEDKLNNWYNIAYLIFLFQVS